MDYLGELKPGMDYSSLEGLAYRLVRLFWWEVLQANPDQADLRLNPETATAWRERLNLTTDGGRAERSTPSCSRSAASTATSPSGPMTTGPLGRLGRPQPGSTIRVPTRVQGPATPEVTHPGPDPRAHPAATAAGDRSTAPQTLAAEALVACRAC